MGTIVKPSIFFWALCSVSLAPQAAVPSDLEQLHQQMNELKKRYEAQSKALQAMEQRLRQIEGIKQVQTSPSRPPKPGDAVPAGRQPAQAAQQAEAPKPAPGTPSTGVTPGTQAAGAGTAKDTGAATQGAGEKVVKEAPTARSVETVLQEEHTLFDKRLTVEAGVTYSRSSRARVDLSGFLALDAIFLGRISIDEVEADIVQMDLTGRYSITDRLQLDLNAPFLYRNSNFQKGGVGGVASSQAEADVTLDPTLGDMNAGVFFRVLKESANWPDTVWNVRVKAPTGTDPFGIKIVERDIRVSRNRTEKFSFPETLPSGNGVWTVSSGFSFVKSVDPAVFFANLSYFHNLEESFDDISSDPDAKVSGDVDLGDSYQFGVGTAFALNERTSISLSYSQRLTEKSRTRVKGGEWTSIVDSDGNAATLNTGVTFGLTNQASLIFNVGVGLTSDAPDVQVGVKFPYSF